MRTFQGHSAPVRSARFLSTSTQVLSTSDDQTVKIWDIPSQSLLYNFTEHTDSVRSSAVSKSNQNILVTGSYDHTLKLWDLRTPLGCVLSLTHQAPNTFAAPVESLLLFPSATMILSAGGTHMLAWDILGASSGRLLNVSNNHQKTITSLCFDGSCRRVLSGSLDHHVKIYDVRDYGVTHSVKYPAPILSLGLSVTIQNIQNWKIGQRYTFGRRYCFWFTFYS